MPWKLHNVDVGAVVDEEERRGRQIRLDTIIAIKMISFPSNRRFDRFIMSWS